MKSGIVILSLAVLFTAGCGDAHRANTAPAKASDELRAALMDLTFNMQDNSAVAVNKGNLQECATLIKKHGKSSFLSGLKAIAVSTDELRRGFAIHLFMEHSGPEAYDALVAELKSKFPNAKAWPSYNPQRPPVPRPEESAFTIAWGEQANGLQAGLKLKSTSEKPRTSVTLVLHLRNASEKPLRILNLSSQATFWGECLPLEIQIAGVLRKYQGPVLDPPPSPPDSAYVYLQPGATDSVEVTMYPEHWKLAPSAEAEVAFVFRNQFQDVKDLWVGVAHSGRIRVKAVPNKIRIRTD